MKITPTCVPCLLNRIIFEANQSDINKKVQTQVIINACRMLAELYDPNSCSAEIATSVHKKTYDIMDNHDPYKHLKEESNQIAQSLVPMVKKRIAKSSNPLKTAILASIVGNTMDFGIKGGSKRPDELKLVFDQIFNEGFGYDDSKNVFSFLKSSKSILYFTDNAGEIVFDKLVCQQLKQSYPHLSIGLVVKGEPVLSDATMKEVKEMAFDAVVDEVFTTGCFAVGVNFSMLPKAVKEKIDEVDLIICKGMANYESFSETTIRPIVYFLRSKCEPIASSMNVPLHANIVKLFE